MDASARSVDASTAATDKFSVRLTKRQKGDRGTEMCRARLGDETEENGYGSDCQTRGRSEERV